MSDILNLINTLEKASIQEQLPGEAVGAKSSYSELDISRLIGYASLLSLSDEPDEKMLSYEIITRLLEVSGGQDKKVITSAEIILSRLGNFPGRSLLRERYGKLTSEISNFLRLECISREVENSVFLNNDSSAQLTDFQHNLYSSLNRERAISVSAPTSAGKSFVLSLNIIRKLAKATNQCIVYIVPTRALITEVSNRIRMSLREHDLEKVVVRTAPFPISIELLEDGVIYVLTQERLTNYLNTEEEMPAITSLVIDEAHEIQKGKRGIILQNAVDLALKKHPSAEVLFASPLIRNPGYFLNLFNIVDKGKFFTETVSPVSQNILLVSEIKGKPTQVNIESLSTNNKLDIGIRNLPFRFRGNKTLQKANFAKSLRKTSESVIIFSNGPADSEKVASSLADINDDFEPSEKLIAFIEFLKREIHPEYSLIHCLNGGVGFHYGKMPSIVRNGIENLFKNGDIQFLCCTSTLLQGVNLPAKHIIIENPKSGTQPMSRADFQNLSGRAGRLLKEFHGNIWCIRPGEWDEKNYEGDRLQEITAAIDKVMIDGGVEIRSLIEESLINDKRIDVAEAAFGKIYNDINQGEGEILERYRTEDNSEELDKTISTIKEINISIPKEILKRNSSVRPDHLQSLYDYLYTKKSLDDLTPESPFKKGAKAKLDKILDIFATTFNWDANPNYRRLISRTAHDWMWGKPLGELISSRVSYVKRNDSKAKTPIIIRDFLDVVEFQVRFKLVQYFSAYIDILRHIYICQKGIDADLEPYHIYLEFGSCDRTTLNIMATGLSRFTALHLSKPLSNYGGITDIDDAYRKIKELNVNRLNIPHICKQEIHDLTGSSA
ncbi:DEAD/DEAH box helicase [Ferrimonas kyonanensis]|uniref:DEAD/DEAH box helicase n=1 Tax=Ferrimonas kyonanensis TaxID=364763 RepID=UPI000425044A|nr:DEAD/DEAH box helicase [Ferrimonas kyonanensis]